MEASKSEGEIIGVNIGVAGAELDALSSEGIEENWQQ